MTTTERTTDRISACPRCLGGVLIPGWEPGEQSCLACGYELYQGALAEEIARAEVAADEQRRQATFVFGRRSPAVRS